MVRLIFLVGGVNEVVLATCGVDVALPDTHYVVALFEWVQILFCNKAAEQSQDGD